jgi:hypothetical protein
MLVEERAAPVYKAVSADRSGMVSQEGKRRNKDAQTQPLPQGFNSILQQFYRDLPNMSMMTQASMKGYTGTGVSMETGIGGGHGGKSVSTEFLHAIDQCHRGKGLQRRQIGDKGVKTNCCIDIRLRF